MREAPLLLDVFCEDAAHEAFVRALLRRQGTGSVRARIRSGRGGRGRATSELRAWFRLLSRGGTEIPDSACVLVDGNCAGWHQRRKEVAGAIEGHRIPSLVIGCPEPHIERWLMADEAAFARVVGVPPPRDPGKCERGVYKRALEAAVEESRLPVLGDPAAELAPDIVRHMDLFRAGKAHPDLRNFVEDLRMALRRAAGEPQEP